MQSINFKKKNLLAVPMNVAGSGKRKLLARNASTLRINSQLRH